MIKALLLAPLALASMVAAGTHEPIASGKPVPIRNVVLVHGAFADGSSYAKVIAQLQSQGYNVTAVQNPLSSLAEDVAATKRAIAMQDGPVILVGHSWAGVVITEAGNDPKVAGLVYIAAMAPDAGQSASETLTGYPQSPGLAEAKPDKWGYLSLTKKGIDEDFVPYLPPAERAVVYATQGPWNSAALADKVTAAAWKAKPTWYIVGQEDRMIPPDYERAVAKRMNATVTTLATGHVPMLSKPADVVAVIVDAATKCGAQ